MTLSLSTRLMLPAAGVAAVALAFYASQTDTSVAIAPAAVPTTGAKAVEIRGVAIQVSNGINPLNVYPRLIREVAELGANAVLLSPHGYMEHARAQTISIDARRTPSPADFRAIIGAAHTRNLRVILMPTVLLSHPRGSEWRGVIDPPDWNEWWRQYRSFLKYFADIARESQVEILMVGSELVSTEKQNEQWLGVIEMTRELAPGVRLGYSANWDHYRPVRFWDRLDLIGMTSYYTLADRKNPSIDEIVEKWTPIRDDILAWRQKIGKPVIFTEVGWCSQEGAATAPWNYFQNTTATPAGLDEQRRLYEGFLRAFHGAAGLEGVIWWEWTDAPGGPADHGYTPRGKPAEQVLRRWFAESAAAETPENEADGGPDAPCEYSDNHGDG